MLLTVPKTKRYARQLSDAPPWKITQGEAGMVRRQEENEDDVDRRPHSPPGARSRRERTNRLRIGSGA